MTRILVWRNKHWDSFYDANTLEELDKASIAILKRLTDPQTGYMQDPGDDGENNIYLSEETRKYADIDLDNLDAEVRSLVEDKVKRARAARDRAVREYKRAKREYDRAVELVKEGSSPLISGVPESWRILDSRSGYEYEIYELVYTEDV